VIDRSPTHDHLLNLLARRGELTREIERIDLDVARYEGMHAIEQAVNLAAPPALTPAAPPLGVGQGGEAIPEPSRSRIGPDSTSGAPTEAQDASRTPEKGIRRRKPMPTGAGG
jgi:hypothetical protein